MKNYFSIVFLLSLSLNLCAQIGGNQIYRNNNNNKNLRFYNNQLPIKNTNIQSTDQTLTISATVLLNKEADYYLMTVGVKEEGKTIADCDKNINDRIAAFKADLMRIGVRNDGIYTDFISQTKIYDHKVESNTITEFLEGFEIRKNLIFKLRDLESIDNIIEAAAQQKIYDIVKVEYFNEDIEEIYDELFDEVIKVIDKKKARFAKHSSVKVSNKYRVIQDNFSVFHPKDLYQQYDEAFETSTMNTYYSKGYIKKEVRKDKTFYYEGVQNNLSADKVIDEISPTIGIQYTLNVSILYQLES